MARMENDELVDLALGEKLGVEYRRLRALFEAAAPEFFVDEKDMTRQQKLLLQRKRNEAWAAFLEVPPKTYSCIKCKDVGWVYPVMAGKDGEIIRLPIKPCPNCSQEEEDRARRRFAYSGVPETQSLATFESFKPQPGTHKALQAARELVMGGFSHLLLIFGSYGNGKTHLAYAAVLEAQKLGMRAKFWYWPELLSAIRQKMDTGEADPFLQQVKEEQFLALDEIGFEAGTEWQAGRLEEIIDYRYRNQLHTIATTNRDIQVLPKPILSRFGDGQYGRIVLNEGLDYRIKKQAPTPESVKTGQGGSGDTTPPTKQASGASRQRFSRGR